MTPEAQRIAIAEMCPTVFVRKTGQSGWNYVSSTAGRVLPCIDGDPLKDLNAMHEAEKLIVCGDPITKSKWFIYLQSHYDLAGIRATAAQRAEVILRTTGKWVEG